MVTLEICVFDLDCPKIDFTIKIRLYVLPSRSKSLSLNIE